MPHLGTVVCHRDRALIVLLCLFPPLQLHLHRL